jgi:hypothetical protein
MTLHAFIEYLKYRWKAMGRHGTHSPFVYDIIENVLLNKGPIPRESIVSIREIGLKYENLVSRICAYFNYTNRILLPGENYGHAEADIIVVNGSKSKDWIGLFESYVGLLQNKGAFIITDIHKNLAYTAEWKKLCANRQVKMSVDVFGLGIMFFRSEFKIKQHFVLKY